MNGHGPWRRGDLRRRIPVREPYAKILIVTEGAKTEAAYFNGMVRHHRLSSANIVVVGQGADPKKVVDVALQLKRKEAKLGDAYDRVYCVFDFNGHASFESASDRARRGGLFLARSWPCFEYWLLLHFRYSRKPYRADGTRSSCDQCIRDLTREMPDYSKAQAGVFETLSDQVEDAKARAKLARDDVQHAGDANPSTEVHLLVAFLQCLNADPQL